MRNLENELNMSMSAVATRDERIKVLERELEVIQRAVESQLQYAEGMASTQQGRETLKALYYELGKRKVDLQSLAASLSAASQEMEYYQNQLKDVSLQKGQLEDLYHEISSKYEEALKNIDEDKQEIENLHGELARNVEIVTVAHAHCEDMSHKLEESRNRSQDQITELSKKITTLTTEVSTSSRENQELRSQVQSLQQRVIHIDNMNALLDEKSKHEVAQYIKERDELSSQIKQCRCQELKRENDTLRRQYDEARSLNEETQIRLLTFREQLEAKSSSFLTELCNKDGRIEQLEQHLVVERTTTKQMTSERDRAVDAFKQAVDATRALNVQYKQEIAYKLLAEKKLRTAERALEDLQRSRMHISNAVMDTLATERERVATLEREKLQQQQQQQQPPLQLRHQPPSRERHIGEHIGQQRSFQQSHQHQQSHPKAPGDDTYVHHQRLHNGSTELLAVKAKDHHVEDHEVDLHQLAATHIQSHSHEYHQGHSNMPKLKYSNAEYPEQQQHQVHSSRNASGSHDAHNHGAASSNNHGESGSSFLLGPQLIASVDVQDDHHNAASPQHVLRRRNNISHANNLDSPEPEPQLQHRPFVFPPAPPAGVSRSWDPHFQPHRDQGQDNEAQHQRQHQLQGPLRHSYSGSITALHYIPVVASNPNVDKSVDRSIDQGSESSYLPKESTRKDKADVLTGSNLDFSVTGQVVPHHLALVNLSNTQPNTVSTTMTGARTLLDGYSNSTAPKSLTSSIESFHSYLSTSSSTGTNITNDSLGLSTINSQSTGLAMASIVPTNTAAPVTSGNMVGVSRNKPSIAAQRQTGLNESASRDEIKQAVENGSDKPKHTMMTELKRYTTK
jgi:predicted  nucleic acid-binding Zn-ribbon protein